MKDDGKSKVRVPNSLYSLDPHLNSETQFHLQHFPIIGSTNTWAKQNARSFPRDKITLVSAEAQTAGRGRFNRKWISPPGVNLYASFCFFLKRNDKDHISVSNLPQVIALAIANSLEEQGFQPKLKWPNDLQLGGKKVSGVLSETTMVDDTLCFIAGIGLNVNMPREHLQQIDQPATSLMVEKGAALEIKEVLEKLKSHFISHLLLFNEQGFSPFLEGYRNKIVHHEGQRIKFHDNCIIWEGMYHAIADDGSLILRLDDGELRRFVAGEICL